MTEVRVSVGGKAFRVRIEREDGGLRAWIDGKPVAASLSIEGDLLRLSVDGEPFALRVEREPGAAGGSVLHRGRPIGYRIETGPGGGARAAEAEAAVRAHMPGLLVSVAVKAGAAVKPGDLLAVLEAMKMQNEIRAKRAGTVKEILAAPGSTLEAGQMILRLE